MKKGYRIQIEINVRGRKIKEIWKEREKVSMFDDKMLLRHSLLQPILFVYV